MFGLTALCMVLALRSVYGALYDFLFLDFDLVQILNDHLALTLS